MTDLGVLPFALAAVGVGLGLLLLAWGLSRWLGTRQPRPAAADPVPALPVEVDLAPTDDAVLVAQAGGRVLFANSLAREWFGLDGGDPDLMVMARQTNPSDSFLELFAAEGRATVEVRAPGAVAAFRRVEAASHRVPLTDGSRIVVVLHETALPLALDDQRAAAAVSVVAEIGRAISASLDLEDTLDAILTNVARIIPYDVGEIALWEAEPNTLRVARRHGERDHLLALEALGEQYPVTEGYGGWLASHRRPLLIADAAQRRDVRPRLNPENPGPGAFLGAPLILADNLIGTLELTSLAPRAFDEIHVRLLETVAGQAAVALQNARRFEDQRRRLRELSGLAEIAQAVGSLTDAYELYRQLTERLAHLMRAQICGILLYDESESALVGQAPFFGLPDAFVALYRIPVTPGTGVYHVWREADYWFTNDVVNDPVISEVGLADLAAAIGARQTLLVPLPLGGRRLGVVQVSNKPEGEFFEEADARQLVALAGQAAALIDNARLVRETRVRAERAEGLRRLSAVGGSAQPVPDILRLAIEEIVRLLSADAAVILLLDETRGELVPHAPSAANVPAEFLNHPPLTMADPLFRVSAVYTRRPFLTNTAQTNQRLHPNYRLLSQTLALNCCLNVPLVAQERGLGEILVGARRENAFGSADLELLQIIAGQVASAIERARLGGSTDESLQRRVRQLTALARVSRQLNQTLDLDRILSAVYDEVLGEATEASCARIILLDSTSPAANGAPHVSRQIGNVVATLDAAAHTTELAPAEAALLADAPGAAGAPSFRRLEPVEEADRLASDARLGLLVPIVYEGSIVGLIHLQSRAEQAFDADVADFVQALADQTAVAVGNANRYDEQIARNELLRRRADQLSQLFQISRSVRADQPMAANLETIAFGVQESTGFDVVIMSLLDPVSQMLDPTAAAGLPLTAFERIKKIRRPWAEIEPLLRPDHRISQSYFIPRRKRADTGPLSSAVRAERSSAAAGGAPPPPDGWQSTDLLLIPFRGSAGEILGVMHLDEPRNRRVPDRLTVETLEIFANQAALAIESARLYQTAEERAAELAQRLTDLSASYGELDEVSRSLVQKDQELTRLVDELDVRNRRLLSVQHVIEVLGSAPDPASLARLVAEAVSGEMQMEACIIALRGLPTGDAEVAAGPLRVAAAAGFAVPAGADLSPLMQVGATDNPIAYTVDRNLPLLVRDVEHSEWAHASLIIGLTLRAFVCVPILLRGRISGALFVASQKAMISFTEQDIDLFTILASQLGISLENAGLYTETRRRLLEQTVLYDTSQELARAAEPRAAIAAVAERMVRQLDATALCYYSYDDSQGLIQADYEYWTPQANREERQSVLGQAWPIADYPYLTASLTAGGQGGEVRPGPRVLRVSDSDLTQTEREMLADYGGQTVVAVPMVVQDRVLGYFEIWDSRVQRRYGEADLRLVQALGNQAAVAYESARLYEQARQFNAQLERTVTDRTRALEFERDRVGTLLRITSELSASLDLDRVLQRALSLVNEVLHASQGSIFLVDPQSDRLLYRAALGRPVPLPVGGQPAQFTRSEGLVGWVIRHRQAVVIADVETDERWLPGVAGRSHRSALAAPLVTNDDILGAILFFSDEPNAFNEDQLGLVSAAAAQVASAINNAELYSLIRDQAERLGSMLRSQQVEASQNRAILESIADGVMVVDASGRIALLNAASQRLLNLAPDLLGRSAASLVGLYGPAGTAWSDAIARWQADPGAYQTGEFLAERFELEDKRVISVHLAPVTAADDYLGSVSLFRDITREVEVDRLKTEFVTTVSHELRTPLTPIKGYVDALLLGMAGPIEQQQQRILGVIKANIDRLSVLVNDLLDISRIESGKIELELEPVSVYQVVDEVAASLAGRMTKDPKKLHVITSVPPGLPPILADRVRITQVLANLAFNAFNYTPDGGTLTLTAQVQSGVMQISVKDTGIGIAPHNLYRIFERFYRGEDPLVLATAGTGLGLSIVKSVIEMHDGRLWAESEGLGKGSTFTFLVPLAE